MLTTPNARYHYLTKYLAKDNEVHLILWDMPYPVTTSNLVKNLKNSWKTTNYIDSNGVHIHKIRRLPFFFPLINRRLFQKQIKKIFNSYSLDVIISGAFFNETEPPKEFPLFFDYTDDYAAFAQLYGSKIYKFAYKILSVNKTVNGQLKRAVAVFAVSDKLVDKARQFNQNVYKIPNGVEPEFGAKSNQQGNLNPHSLAYISTFGKWSKLQTLVELVAEMRIKYPDIRLTAVGDGAELKAAKNLSEKRGLRQNIIFTGRIDQRDRLAEIIKASEICLNISDKNEFRDASSPIKIFEYSFLGKKIVSTNLNEVVQLNLANVFIYRETSAKDKKNNLRKALEQAFISKIDSSTARQIISDKYLWPKLIDDMVQIIKSNTQSPKTILSISFDANSKNNNAATTHTLCLAKELASLCDNVVLVTGSIEPTHSEGNLIKVNTPTSLIEGFFLTKVFRLTKNNWLLYRSAIKYGKDANVIYERHNSGCFVGLLISKRLRKPLYYEVNSLSAEEAMENHNIHNGLIKGLFHKLMQLQLSQASGVIVQTQELKQLLKKTYTVKNVSVISNGASTHSRNNLKRPVRKHSLNVVYVVGTIDIYHSVTDTLDIFKELGDTYRIKIVGSGPTLSNLIKKYNGYPNIIFTGNLTFEKAQRQIQLADIGIAHYNLDSPLFQKYGFYFCPLKLLEYSSYGKPTIMIGASNSFVQIFEEAGACIVLHKPQELKSTLLDISRNPEKIKDMSTKALKIAKLFSWETAAKKTMEVLNA